jgi:hypothetical protein
MPTACHRKDCHNDAHVLLFATGHQFLGQPTRPGQAIYLCLGHGGQVYDVLAAWRESRTASTPGWLADDAKANRLPTVLPHQRWTVRRAANPRRPRGASR